MRTIELMIVTKSNFRKTTKKISLIGCRYKALTNNDQFDFDKTFFKRLNLKVKQAKTRFFVYFLAFQEGKFNFGLVNSSLN